MRFSYAEAMTDPTFYIPLAKAAEAAGYTGMTIPDSVAYPFESDSEYPYTPEGNREFLDGKAFIETFVLTAALGAVTSTLRFNFFYRDIYNSLQEYDANAFWYQLLWVFVPLATLNIAIGMFDLFVDSSLLIRWRTWLKAI